MTDGRGMPARNISLVLAETTNLTTLEQMLDPFVSLETIDKSAARLLNLSPSNLSYLHISGYVNVRFDNPKEKCTRFFAE